MNGVGVYFTSIRAKGYINNELWLGGSSDVPVHRRVNDTSYSAEKVGKTCCQQFLVVSS